MDLELYIPRNALRAVSHCASNKDVRYYLNGILIECTNHKVSIVATDGCVLGIYRIPEHCGTDDFSIIVPNEIVGRIKKSKFTLALYRRGEQWGILDGDVKLEFTPIDGRFPDWRRVVPSDTCNVAGSYSLDLLAVFAKAAREFGSDGSKVCVHQNGPNKAALVELYCDPMFCGVVMPKRDDLDNEHKAPDWLN
jgi:DNA polymerase-3 subunit beta